MSEDVELAIDIAREAWDSAIDHLQKELTKIRTGKASPSMLHGIMIEYYGVPTPLQQVANIGAVDSKTLTIQPWEKSLLATIEQAIFAANIGLTPMNDGEFIRINIPPLTEERRRQFVKQAKSLGEDTKISLRNTRHKAMETIKNAIKDGYPEDAGKRKEEEIEKTMHDYGEKIDKLVDAKEKDIMTI